MPLAVYKPLNSDKDDLEEEVCVPNNAIYTSQFQVSNSDLQLENV